MVLIKVFSSELVVLRMFLPKELWFYLLWHLFWGWWGLMLLFQGDAYLGIQWEFKENW